VLQELRTAHQIPDTVSDSELLDAAAVALAGEHPPHIRTHAHTL